MVVMATSGSGEEMMDEVDGLSGASIMENVPENSSYLIDKIKSILDL